jgi:FtsP/CotA-like multicopper oxidase with cupredoxin domain
MARSKSFQPDSNTSGRDPALPRLGRRDFLGALGGGAVAFLLPTWARSRGVASRPGSGRHPGGRPFEARLPIPRELRGSRLSIPMREAEVQILPGRKTRMWTYGGTFPGPTIRRPAGHRTEVTFRHELPSEAGELTVHLHGGHNRSEYDGQPGGLTRSHPHSFYCEIPRGLSSRASGNDLLIHPGSRKTYVYDLVEDGRPERAAFQWYHDHRLDHTARNVWHGLAGMWIIDDELDEALPLPKGRCDIPLMIADRSFDRHNQLANPFSTGLRPPNDGVVGDHVLVNGAYLPHHHVSPRRYRLRLLNVSQFRALDVHLSNGAQLVQIATDSGLMPKPVRRDSILLGPAERAEAIVDFGKAAGESVELRSGYGRRGGRTSGARSHVGALMQFRVDSRRVPDRTRIPRSLRPLPGWARNASHKPDRTWTISLGGTFSPVWQINGRTFNPAHSDAFPVLGTTETWEIVNRTTVSHMMHMHHTDWYLLSRDGKPPPPWEDCLKETFFVHPGERIRIAGHFSDYTGKFVIHCHMLDHEDHGLMGQFEVVGRRRGGH